MDDPFFLLTIKVSQDPDTIYEHLSSFMTEGRRNLFEDVLAQRTRHITVALEDVYQPHNASAILRSCDCLGIQDIHIAEAHVQYEVNSGVSLGSSKWLTLHKYGAGEQAMRRCYDELRSKGYRIVATTPHTNDCSIGELDISTPVALVFGTELRGLSEFAIENADEYVYIPMVGFTESFNISVAAALSLYDLTSRLRTSKVDWSLREEEKSQLRLEWAKASVKSSDKILARYLEENERD